MLPSTGYFSSIPCVFYLGAGCGRPCCHYRHSSRDKSPNSDQKVSDDTTNVETKISNSAIPQYEPTPIADLNCNKPDIPIVDKTLPHPYNISRLSTPSLSSSSDKDKDTNCIKQPNEHQKMNIKKPQNCKNLKRKVSNDQDQQTPTKKTVKSLKLSVNNGITGRIDEPTTVCTTNARNITSSNLVRGGIPSPIMAGSLEPQPKPVPSTRRQNFAQTTGTERNQVSYSTEITRNVDPFSRWMKNKKLRDILGKNKNDKSGGETVLKSVKKQEVANPEKFIDASGVESEDTEVLPIPKFTQRVAHEKNQIRLFPKHFENSKIPYVSRQHFCDAFFREFKKTMGEEEAKLQAVEKELELAKSSGVQVYKHKGSMQLIKLRKNGCHAMANEPKDAILMNPSSCPPFTHGWSLFKCFSKYLLTQDQLRENGYPLPIPGKPNCAFTEKSARKYSKEQPSESSFKICANCGEKFEIGENGVSLTKNDCFYHWGKLRTVKLMGQRFEKFVCCDGLSDASPCETSACHVWAGVDEDCMFDFEETRKLPSYMDECDAGIYAVDCEMCYTTEGLELARLTVVDLNENVVFDQVVSLKSPVLDYCTRFSGIDEDKIRQATYSFNDVRSWVLSNIFDKTILIGHSLENDLKALKLIHKTVIDTSITFPHKFGPPNRMSLKHLANSLLSINIQENENGHDSKEDAITCLKLLMMKIKEDSKARKPRTIIGYDGKKK